jgi:DNA-binding NtrC family response regulator
VVQKIDAIVAHSQPEPFQSLTDVLQSLGIEVRHARTFRELSDLLKNPGAAELVFTDSALPDGTFADVLRLANGAGRYMPVIVVSRTVDINLYLDVLDSGAFDFVAPPFQAADLAHIIRSAMYKELSSGVLQATPVA